LLAEEKCGHVMVYRTTCFKYLYYLCFKINIWTNSCK